MDNQNTNQGNKKRSSCGCNDKARYYKDPRDFGYKKKMSLWKKLLIGFLALFALAAIFGPKSEKGSNSSNNNSNNQPTQQNTKTEYNLGETYEKDAYTLTVSNSRVLTDTFGKKYRVVDLEVNAKKEVTLGFKTSGITEDGEVVNSSFAVCGHSDLKAFPFFEKVSPGLKIKGQEMFEIKGDKDIKKLRITENGKDIFYNL